MSFKRRESGSSYKRERIPIENVDFPKVSPGSNFNDYYEMTKPFFAKRFEHSYARVWYKLYENYFFDFKTNDINQQKLEINEQKLEKTTVQDFLDYYNKLTDITWLNLQDIHKIGSKQSKILLEKLQQALLFF